MALMCVCYKWGFKLTEFDILRFDCMHFLSNLVMQHSPKSTFQLLKDFIHTDRQTVHYYITLSDTVIQHKHSRCVKTVDVAVKCMAAVWQNRNSETMSVKNSQDSTLVCIHSHCSKTTDKISATVFVSFLMRTEAEEMTERCTHDVTSVAEQLRQHNSVEPLTPALEHDDTNINNSHSRLCIKQLTTTHVLSSYRRWHTTLGSCRRHLGTTAAAKDEHWKMFDMRLPLSRQLEKLDTWPLNSVYHHCNTHRSHQLYRRQCFQTDSD